MRRILGKLAGSGMILLGACALGSRPAAAVEEQTDLSPTVLYQAIDVLASYLEEDLKEISDITRKTAVVNYTQSEELPESVKSYLLKKIEQAGKKSGDSEVRFLQCIECLTVRAEAEGDEVFIKKGITDDKELNETLKRLGIRKYSDVNLTYGGRFVSLQMSVVDQDRVVSWSKEYRTPYNDYNDSQWMLGAGIEAVAFQDDKLPSPKAGRVYFGQRLFGIGAVGLSATLHEKTDELAAISTYAGFFELNHNEFFGQYWDFVQLMYQVELGVTDFNGSQQFAESIGVKTKFGQYFTIRLAAHTNQFIQKPEDDSEIYNPNGEPLLRNDEALPTRFSLGLGFEFL